MAEIEEKVFHYFLEFSPKVRMIVIDEMETADRCRLTRCSELCDKEAKASKNYIYELDLFHRPSGFMRINVVHGLIGSTEYSLLFNSEKKLKTYMNQRHETLWETDLDSDTDVAQLAFEEFKSFLQKYQRNVRQLRIFIYSPEETVQKIGSIDFGIESLDSLEHLMISGVVDAQAILSKLRKPLKTLIIEQNDNSDITEQIYQVQEDLTWLGAKFDNQQFLQLYAKRVGISIGKLTERNIFSFIRSWQNGTIGKDIEHCTWFMYNSDFSRQKLLKFLRIRDYVEGRWLDIKHFKDDGKYARLFISEHSISFDVTQ